MAELTCFTRWSTVNLKKSEINFFESNLESVSRWIKKYETNKNNFPFFVFLFFRRCFFLFLFWLLFYILKNKKRENVYPVMVLKWKFFMVRSLWSITKSVKSLKQLLFPAAYYGLAIMLFKMEPLLSINHKQSINQT